ncbi:hypothetical protein [Xaviernesmea oryzae]|uniref:hypothetical protein n=1 Tax=Xaviernesmea oryzae TaxID=464029 RepID=UPI002E105DEF
MRRDGDRATVIVKHERDLADRHDLLSVEASRSDSPFQVRVTHHSGMAAPVGHPKNDGWVGMSQLLITYRTAAIGRLSEPFAQSDIGTKPPSTCAASNGGPC